MIRAKFKVLSCSWLVLRNDITFLFVYLGVLLSLRPETEKANTKIKSECCARFGSGGERSWTGLRQQSHVYVRKPDHGAASCRSEESVICYISDSCFGRNMALSPVFNHTGMSRRI